MPSFIPSIVEQAPWLREAERLAAFGLMLPDIATALSQLGYPDLAVTFAVAAIRSDKVRAQRVERSGVYGRPL